MKGFVKVFADTDPSDAFAAVKAAERWLEERGYSVGIMQAHGPRGILKGDYDIQKWRNLRPRERSVLDGQMVGGRGGPVMVTIWRNVPEEGLSHERDDEVKP